MTQNYIVGKFIFEAFLTLSKASIVDMRELTPNTTFATKAEGLMKRTIDGVYLHELSAPLYLS